ncbi:TonB-dependent receptor [Cruoricaptor ignavus]|uniref:TonB-dependent receptor n=1 Tax=Cruoricaptor ignavus TaxID=1118202 RepID=A0A1M5ZZ91_9FLAO|nr:TonB-dependent receptor [Cruoricaptor ignavus]SHI29571.1 TonB-dependent receptor [Cruoricaptor ignavus]
MKKYIISLPLMLIAPAFLYAQEIRGTVQSSERGEAVAGANIVLQPGNIRTQTGLDGSFSFLNLEDGSYSITISHPRFQGVNEDIIVSSDQAVTVSYSLPDKDAREISGVTILGIRRHDTEGMARRIEQRAPEVVNVVSGNAIQISPDLSVANVIQRVSGVSVERSSNGEGQYAILRGMDKRYNYTLVNGVKIPSPENRHRYVPLDIFPSELLDRLEVYKSLLPYMEGDAIGGGVNMVMKSAPAARDLSANMAVGYSQALFERKFHSFDTSDIKFKSPYERFGRSYNATVADFPKSRYQIERLNAMPNFTGGLTLGRRFADNKLGVLAAVSYQNSNRMTDSKFYSTSNVDTMKYGVITSESDRKYFENQQRMGAYGILDFRINANHQLKLFNSFMLLRNTQLRERLTANASNANYEPLAGNADLSYSYRSRFTQQRIWNTTLRGEHSIIPGRFSLDWSGVVSSADNQVPDQTNFGTLGIRRNFVDTQTSPNNAFRTWLRNTDNDYAGYLNLKVTVADGFNILAGGMYRDKERSHFYNNYSLYPVSRNHILGTDFMDVADIQYNVENPKGAVANSLTYDAAEKIAAGYGMLEAKLEKIELSGGIRFEHTDQSYTLLFPMGEDRPELSQKYTDALPSASVKYKITPTQNLRATYFKSINRPGFFEIVPSKLVYEEYSERGNPDLKRAKADNVDLRYEFFPKASDQYMVGVFYKNIKDPIEYTLQPDKTRGQDIFYSPGNFGSAENYGVEVDVIKFFSSFGFKANYTYTHSEITTPKSVRVRDAAGNLETITQDQKRPLYGQSEHIANLSLLYKNPQSGWDAQIAGSYTGPRISTVSQFLDNDIWQKGFIRMDASLEKRLGDRLSIYAKANNLLDTPMKLFIKGVNEQNADIAGQDISSGETLIRKDFYKQTYLLGLRVKF